MQSWGVLGAALKRPVAGPAGVVDIHRSSGSEGGSGGGRAVCTRRPRVRERVSGSGEDSRRDGLLGGEAGVVSGDGRGTGAGGGRPWLP